MKTFPAIVLGIFILMTFIGVFSFATFSSTGGSAVGKIVVWGSIDKDIVEKLISDIRSNRDDFSQISYVENSPEELIPEMVSAIASGNGPDLVLFPSSSIVENSNKLQVIPYSAISKRTFQDTYVEAGEAYLNKDGVLGLPIQIDPLVMYWNRTLFSNAAIARPPRYWDEVVTLTKQLTKKSPSGTLLQSTIAFGEWGNIEHAKEQFVTLVDQLGIPTVSRDEDDVFMSRLQDSNGSGVVAADSALRYWTDYSNPLKPAYSWNRSQRNSREAFIAGTSALYVGTASELKSIREANPNLNFDVAPLPTVRGGGERVASHMVAVAVPRGTKNSAGALEVAKVFGGKDASIFLTNLLSLPSARRDVEPDATTDPFLSTFRAAALKAFVFLDPNSEKSDAVFSKMVNAVSSGRLQVSEAISSAHLELEELLRMR